MKKLFLLLTLATITLTTQAQKFYPPAAATTCIDRTKIGEGDQLSMIIQTGNTMDFSKFKPQDPIFLPTKLEVSEGEGDAPRSVKVWFPAAEFNKVLSDMGKDPNEESITIKIDITIEFKADGSFGGGSFGGGGAGGGYHTNGFYEIRKDQDGNWIFVIVNVTVNN